MVSAVSSNLSNLYQISKADYPTDTKVAEVTIGKPSSSKLDFSKAALNMLQHSNTFEEFKNARTTQIKAEFPQGEEFEAKMTPTDFKKEFQDFMESRGCKNEEELQALNKVVPSCKTVDDLKNIAKAGMISVQMNTISRNPGASSYFQDIDSIISSFSTNSLANYANSAFSSLETNAIAMQNLLTQVEGGDFNTDDLKRMSSDIDTMFKQVKEEEELNKQGQTVNFDKYLKAYQQQLMAQYGQ